MESRSRTRKHIWLRINLSVSCVFLGFMQKDAPQHICTWNRAVYTLGRRDQIVCVRIHPTDAALYCISLHISGIKAQHIPDFPVYHFI